MKKIALALLCVLVALSAFACVIPADKPTLTDISCTFEQGERAVYTSDTVDSLKEALTVTASYSDGTSEAVTEYTLTGELTAGEATVTVTYMDKTATFTVNVTEVAAAYIEAEFDKGENVIYTSTAIEALKEYLTVTVFYNNGTSEVTQNYTLTGEMAEGNTAFTVSAAGKTATFSTRVEGVYTTAIEVAAAEGNLDVMASIEEIRALLTVTAIKNDGTSEVTEAYTLTGSVQAGESTFTVAYDMCEATVALRFAATAEELSEEGSMRTPKNVGDKFIENFAEANEGMAYEIGYGNEQSFAIKCDSSAINGYGFYVTYGEPDRSVIIMGNLGLTAGCSYTVSFDFKSFGASTIDELGVEIQFANIWTSRWISEFPNENGVYHCSYNFSLPKPLSADARMLIYAPRHFEGQVQYVVDNFVLELTQLPPVDVYPETGSTTALSAVGDKYVENFAEIPEGIVYDCAWGNNQEFNRNYSGEGAIDGNALYVKYSGEGRSAVIVDGLKLKANYGYKVTFAFKVLSQTVPAEIGVEVQYGNVWASTLVNNCACEDGVYTVEISFNTLEGMNENDARILIYCPRPAEQTAEIVYLIDNLTVAVTRAGNEESKLTDIDETGSVKDLSEVGAFYKENFSDIVKGDGNFDGFYGTTSDWGITTEDAIAGSSYYINYTNSNDRGCMLIYGITLKKGNSYTFACDMKYGSTSTAAVVDVEAAGGVHSQYLSHFKVVEGVYKVEVTFVAGQDSNGTIFFRLANFGPNAAVKMVVDNVCITCNVGDIDESGSVKDLTVAGASYKENFSDIVKGDGSFDGYYGTTTDWGIRESGISGATYYLNYSNSNDRGCMLIYGIKLKKGNTYTFACDMKYTSESEAAVADLEAAGAVHSQYISHFAKVGDVYRVSITFVAGQDTESTIFFRLANFGPNAQVELLVDNVCITCDAAA
ncbi:MAG: bacterial Ig-like domain-containing protein [Clostridia bacterium]|nr:bacterial Ig-like domain-containing protein [Clostridia bacterium]